MVGEKGAERRERGGEIAEDVVASHAKDKDTNAAKVTVASSVVVSACIVDGPVDLDPELQGRALEVEDETCDDVLAAESPAGLPLAQTRPEARFGKGRSTPQISCLPDLRWCRAETFGRLGVASTSHTDLIGLSTTDVARETTHATISPPPDSGGGRVGGSAEPRALAGNRSLERDQWSARGEGWDRG